MSFIQEKWFKIISEYKESDCTPKEFYEKRKSLLIKRIRELLG